MSTEGVRWWDPLWIEMWPSPVDQLHAVPGDAKGPAWTISPDPLRPGWQTDGGRSEYGLPEAVAKRLAGLWNEALRPNVNKVAEAFRSSDYLRRFTILCPGHALRLYGYRFVVHPSTGEVVGVDWRYPDCFLRSRRSFGELAGFEEAIEMVIDDDPYRDRIVRARPLVGWVDALSRPAVTRDEFASWPITAQRDYIMTGGWIDGGTFEALCLDGPHVGERHRFPGRVAERVIHVPLANDRGYGFTQYTLCRVTSADHLGVLSAEYIAGASAA